MTNKYEAIGLDMLGDEERARAATVEFAAGTTPAQEAEAAALAQRTGAPVDAVRADPDGARKEAERRQLAALSPTTQRWLTENPNRYALVKDDVEQVNRLGLTISRTFEAARDFGLSSGWRTLSDHLAEWDNIGDNPDAAPGVRAAPDPFYAEEIARSLFAGYERGLGNTGFVGLPDLRSAETRRAAESVARGLGYESDADYQAARTGGFIAEQERRAQQIERTSEATDQAFAKIAAANETDSLWEALGLVWEGRRAVGTVVGQSLGMGAPGLAMTAATGGTSRLATAATAGGSSGFVEYGASISEALSEAGVDVTDSRAVTAALRNPAIMENARDRATKRGVTIGLFDAVTAGLAGQLLINARRGVSSAALRTGGEVGIQAGGGAAGELAAQVVAGDDIKLGDIILEGVAELPFAAVEGRANYVTARERGQVRWINEQLDIVRRSSSGAEALAAATAAAAESNLGQRSPAEAQAFALAAGAEGAVYIDAEVARTLFQSDWQVLVDAVGGDAALTEQLAAGDVAIPADQYFGKIAQLPYAADIARNARVQADALSAVEMESFDIDALADALAGDTSEAAERATPGQPTTRQRVQEDVYGQLISTGRYTDAAAQAQAKLWGAFFASMESRYGADGWAAYEQRMRGIGTAAADGRADPRSTRPWLGGGKLDALLDSIRSDAGPSQSAIMGPSLSAFVKGLGGISDDTGELRGMDAGRLRIGLINAQGVTLDRAREAAAEAGYLPMDSDINDLLDLLDRDLRDGDVFSEQQADRSRVEFETAKSDLQAAIDDNDYLRALSNDEFRALTNQQIADALFGGSMMDQGEAGSFDNPLPESEMESAPVGAWVAGPALPGLDTRRQIMDVPLDRIDATEFDSAGQLAPEKRADAERYAEAMRAGEPFPNGRGSELPNGMIKLQDGHRRLAAARAAGAESMRLAVSPLALAQAANFDQTAAAFDESVFRPAVVSWAQDRFGDLVAPNGRPAWQNFVAWFGESQAVDSAGAPLVVYHGSPDARFMDADATFMSMQDRFGAQQGVGAFWFAESRRTASTYADDRRAFDYQNAEARIIPAFLSLQNPLIIDAKGQKWGDAQRRGATTTVIDEAIANGHDGVIIRNVRDDYVNLESAATTTFTVFDSRQIKSADANTGNFDPTNASVLNQGQSAVTDNPAFRSWFGESKVVDAEGRPLVVYHGSTQAFDRFERTGVTDFGFLGRGFYFSSSAADASEYANQGPVVVGDDVLDGATVYPVYLSIKNPLVITEYPPVRSSEQAEQYRADLEAQGYDGVIFTPNGDASRREFAAFRPEQIKSATANSGAFDPSNPSILYQPAYHGTPHDVDRFSLQRIGSGEGAQAYGWGLYFASQREVADFYRRNLTGIARNIPATMGDQALQEAGGDRGRAVATLTRRRDALPEAARGNTQAAIDWLRRGQDTGRLYEVDVPEDSDLLDYDKPLSEQPGKVRDAVMPAVWLLAKRRATAQAAGTPLSQNDINTQAEFYRGVILGGTGKALYDGLSSEHGLGTSRAASEYLLSVGIPGLRYLDGDSRGSGGTHNYVIWDEAAISEPVRLFQSGDAGVGVEANPNFRRWSNDATLIPADRAMDHEFKSGQKVAVQAYHGTKRPDRIGEQFRRARATSGPMAFFTSDPDIASNYATGKNDTSIDLEENPFESWFKFKPKGQRTATDIIRAWHYLTPEQKDRVFDLAPKVRMDDQAENIILDEDNTTGVGNYDYELQLTQRGYDRRGNPLKALVEGWLNGGTLYDQEGRFMEVLELAGFPVEDVTFDSPYAEFPSVYPVYLAMQSPLVTNDIPQDVVDALNAAAKRDRSRAKYESGVDAWDKNTRTLREWVEQFNEDDSFVWTSIPDKVTKLLADMGYDGIIDVGGKQGGATHKVYIPFGENQVKSQFNRGTFGDTKNIMRQGGQQAAPRGQIQIYPDRSMAISLFETANRSTFLHETGHFFLEVLRDMAAADDAPQQARDDMAALLSWFGVESADQIAVEHHEQFARGFEKYLGEGRAPSPELQSAFSQFKAWLLSVYRSLVNLNVNLTDDVRGVMDRMLAADEEIEAAHVRQGMEPLAFADGVLEEAQIRQYADQLTAATERGRAALGARLMAAHDRAARRWYKEQKAEVRKEVEAEYSALPVYRAARVLAGAKTFADGTPIPDELRGMKLDRDALVAVYGEAYLQRIRGMYAREGGVDQDVAAMRLGFESGDALLNALANREDMAARVTAETDARMVERYGDPMVDGTLPERAMEAVHGDHRMRVLAWEMAVLEALAADPLAVPDAARPVRSQEGQAERPRPQVSPETRARIREAQGRRTAATRALAEVARRSIAKKTLRDIRPNDYLVAERKAAVKAAAASARGNYAEALQAKRQQAFNAAMYRQAKAAQARAESNVRFLRKASSDATRARIGKQAGKFYVDALDAIFHGIEVRGVSRPQVARRAALRDWVRRMQDEGNSTAVPEMLLARVESENVTNLADMTVGDVEGLREAVGNILHLARTKNRLLTAKGQRDWEDVKAEMMDRLEQQPDRHGRAGISDADRRLFERIADLYAAGSNWVLQPETLVEWLDAGTTGPFHDLLWDQAQAAERKREALNRAVGGKLQEALDALPAADRKALDRRFRVESLGGDVSGHSILSALLNMGNAGNRDKLTRGGRVVGDEIVPFTPEQLADMFAKLTRPQAEMVQKVWDAIDTLWPEIVALEESMNGIAPERVESTPVTVITRDGPVALRGGYYPAMYDPKGARAGQFSEDEQAKRVLSGQTPIRASTSKGHTEKRTDFAAPLLLDYQAVLTRHLDGVIGDIAYRQFLRQVYKVLGDADIRRMIDNRVGPGAAVGLRKGFERGATGNFSLAGPLLGPFQRVADATMTNLSSAALGFRIPLALANVVAVPLQAAARVPYRYVLRGLRDYYLSGGANLIGNMRRNAEMVQRLSPLMLRRSEARSVELSSIIANLRGQRGFRAKMIEMAMSVHQWTVPLAENAIWMGAYQQAADAGATPTEAVTAADKAIRQTQTKTSAAELSQGEGGYMRMFMQFAGPLVIMNNRMQEAGLRGLRGDVHSWPQALGVWFAVAMGAAWSFELIMGRGPDGDDGEDPDVVDWVAWAAKKLALLPFAAFPMVRDAASYLDSGFSRSTPLVESMKSVIDTFGGLAESLFGDEEVDAEKVTKQAVRAAGVATGVPSNQLLRTGDYLMSVSTGEHEMGNPAAEAYYLVQGAPDED